MEAEPLLDEFVARRYAIAFHYKVLLGLPPRDQWAGHDGTVSKICKIMGLSGSGGTVVNIRGILEDILRCQEQGIAYVPVRNCPRMGPQPIVSVDSSEAQIIADCVEDGMSISLTLLLVNKHRTETEKIPLTRSVVNHTIKRLSPKSSTIKKSKQGSRDAASKWARARFRWTKQLMVRLGLLGSDSSEDCFCYSKMEPQSMEGIAWWDETHTKCVIGGIGNGLSHFHVKFPRDEDGKVDLKNSSYSDEEKSTLKVKYEKEVRLCLGCAVVHNEDGSKVGKRAHPFCYLGRIIITLKDLALKRKQEISRVKAFTSVGAGFWVNDPRQTGDFFHDDEPDLHLKGCAKATMRKLGKHGITTVGHIRDMTDENIQNIVSEESYLPRGRLIQLREEASKCQTRNKPRIKDHRKEANPYESKFGSDWEEHIDKSVTLSQYVCITDMVEHIFVESAKLFKGAKHEHDWSFYHDALSLMTAKDTI
jgi:hypothetical protein